MGMLSEFKEFINKGNVVDLAVGVVIGGAFGKIVTSFVGDLLMPIIGQIMGGASLADLKYVFTPAVIEAGKVVKPENAFRYGSFIQTILDFLIIAFAVFLVVKVVNRMRRKVEEAPAGPTPTESLLTEIRDLLKSR